METTFQEFLDKHINLTQGQISQGSKSHQYIRNLLANRPLTDSSFPWLVDGDFLSGSYGRGTKLYPLDDIDVMLVLDGAGLFPIDGGKRLDTHYARGNGENKKGPVHTHLGTDGLLSSHRVLEIFQEALNQSHPESTISRDGQAINVHLASYGLGIDIVPCFHIVPHDRTQKDFYYIPQGGDSAFWLKTNPKTDAEISKNLHERHNRKLKGVIKLLKYWNREKNADRLRSYHLETAAWYAFFNHPSAITSTEEGIRYFFDNARPYLDKQLLELTGFGRPVDTYLTFQDRQSSLAAFDRAGSSIRSMGLLTPASRWKAVFGDKFGN